jgi:hypothetical protein
VLVPSLAPGLLDQDASHGQRRRGHFFAAAAKKWPRPFQPGSPFPTSRR